MLGGIPAQILGRCGVVISYKCVRLNFARNLWSPLYFVYAMAKEASLEHEPSASKIDPRIVLLLHRLVTSPC